MNCSPCFLIYQTYSSSLQDLLDTMCLRGLTFNFGLSTLVQQWFILFIWTQRLPLWKQENDYSHFCMLLSLFSHWGIHLIFSYFFLSFPKGICFQTVFQQPVCHFYSSLTCIISHHYFSCFVTSYHVGICKNLLLNIKCWLGSKPHIAIIYQGHL